MSLQSHGEPSLGFRCLAPSQNTNQAPTSNNSALMPSCLARAFSGRITSIPFHLAVISCA